MRTHHGTGNPGCIAVNLKHFCSTCYFWKLVTFITTLSGNKCKRGICQTQTFFGMGLHNCEDVSLQEVNISRIKILQATKFFEAKMHACVRS